MLNIALNVSTPLASILATMYASPKRTKSLGLPRKAGELPNMNVWFTAKLRKSRPFLEFAPTIFKRLGQDSLFFRPPLSVPSSMHIRVSCVLVCFDRVPISRIPSPTSHFCISRDMSSSSPKSLAESSDDTTKGLPCPPPPRHVPSFGIFWLDRPWAHSRSAPISSSCHLTRINSPLFLLNK